jgi:signal transduction histidine kinase
MSKTLDIVAIVGSLRRDSLTRRLVRSFDRLLPATVGIEIVGIGELPLAGVLAYGEMLFKETSGDSKLKRYPQNVLIAATRGREIVGQILTDSRTQRRARVPVDLATVVAETLELIRGSLPAGIRLEASAPETPLVLIGDATQLHQVAMNLCTNAIQAMSTGGTLRVALESAELPSQALSHGTLEPGRYVRLIVADSGSGMNENILAHIFEPFFTTKEVGKGTGLGLSLVHAIITDFGGAIDVQSAPQQGSTFTIYLPQSQVRMATLAGSLISFPQYDFKALATAPTEGS